MFIYLFNCVRDDGLIREDWMHIVSSISHGPVERGVQVSTRTFYLID